MTAKQQWLVVAAIVAVAGGAVATGAYLLRGQLAQVTVGSKAPGIHAVTVDDAPVQRTLADYTGQVVWVNVWATWCIPCETEMPILQRLYEEYQKKGLRLAAVSIDVPGMEPEIRRFVERYGLTFDVLHDEDSRIKRDYMTSAVPESFIVGKDGVIRFKEMGAISERDAAQIRLLLDRLLAE